MSLKYEPSYQVVFADKILLNKIDLVTPECLEMVQNPQPFTRDPEA